MAFWNSAPSNRVAITAVALGFTPLLAVHSTAAPLVTVNSKTFDLAQFTGAAVTYRADAGNGVDFDGKGWDNFVGLDGFSLGELASGQYGSDPGDQISLTATASPDWLQLTYGGTGLTIGSGGTEFVVFEITSSSSGVDDEGLSWKIGFNGNTPFAVTTAEVTHFPSPGSGAEDTNMGVFDLLDYGFSIGDKLTSVYIENIDSGKDTSDPDFIFAGLAIPEPASLMILLAGGLMVSSQRRR